MHNLFQGNLYQDDPPFLRPFSLCAGWFEAASPGRLPPVLGPAGLFLWYDAGVDPSRQPVAWNIGGEPTRSLEPPLYQNNP